MNTEPGILKTDSQVQCYTNYLKHVDSDLSSLTIFVLVLVFVFALAGVGGLQRQGLDGHHVLGLGVPLS